MRKSRVLSVSKADRPQWAEQRGLAGRWGEESVDPVPINGPAGITVRAVHGGAGDTAWFLGRTEINSRIGPTEPEE